MNPPAIPSRPTNGTGRFTTRRVALLVLIVAAGTFFLARQDWISPSLEVTNGINGSGTAATQTRALPSFTAIDLTGSSTITVHVGAEQAVVVHADDNLLDHVKTEVRNGTLVVSERGSFATSLPLRVEVTVARLDGTKLAGSGTISVDGVDARTFTAEVPGSGMLTVSGTGGPTRRQPGWLGNHAAGWAHRPHRHRHRSGVGAPRGASHPLARRIDNRQRTDRLQR